MLAKVFVCPEIVVPMANDKVADGRFQDERVLSFTEEKLRDFVGSLQ